MKENTPDTSLGNTCAERVLACVQEVQAIIQQDNPIDETLDEIAMMLPKGFTHTEDCLVSVLFEDVKAGARMTESSSAFSMTERFTTIDGRSGAVDVSYAKDHPTLEEGPFYRQERFLLNYTAKSVANYINRIVAEKSHSQSIERLKELSVINRTTRIINASKSVDDALQQIVFVLPGGWQYPEFTAARITLENKTFVSDRFVESEWVQTKRFGLADGQKGSIDIFYVRDLSFFNEDPFLSEERDLLNNVAQLITEFIDARNLRQEQSERRERVKELKAINETTRLIGLELPLDATLQQIADVLPQAMQHPDYSVARLLVDDLVFESAGFVETPWVLRQRFETLNGRACAIEIFYLKETGQTREELFLNEENDLIINLSQILLGYLNSIEGKALKDRANRPLDAIKSDNATKTDGPVYGKHLLQNFMHKNNAARDIYHDLMPFKVKEILLVANLYDAYAIESEGRFTEQVLGDFYQLHISSLPRVTGVTTYEEALGKLNEKHFDLIIVMVGVDRQSPMDLSRRVKKDFPYIPIFLLLNNDHDLPYFQARKKELGVLDELFVWNGDPKVFSSMVFHLEDKVNVENDTQIGLARVILLVEDSVRYYSKYLPLLYASVLEQTRHVLDDVQGDELYAVLRLRARPKVLLATNYEDAKRLLDTFQDYLLCLISDVEFERDGRLADNAGFELVNYAKSKIKDLPVIMQSSKIEYSRDAFELKTVFINKNSDSLIQDIKTFISHYLGFGNFAYKDGNGRTIAIARNLKEFEQNLRKVPAESVVYHAKKNHFSLWLMARGEIRIAKLIAPYRITDFDDAEDIRSYLLTVINEHGLERNQGKVVDFDDVDEVDEFRVVSMSGGSLGGKGRGLAFINSLLYNFNFAEHVAGISICTPRTTVIGTDEFELFMERNNFRELAYRQLSYHKIKAMFMEGELSQSLVYKLKRLLGYFSGPLAVRSSGLLEDSQRQPFAGVYETYLLPNNHSSETMRLKQLCDAIKLVYASVYSEMARAYTEAIDYKVDEEKMAIVIQEAVGQRHGSVFYPHISGVAQSYNYYTYGHMNPEDGFAVMALGFGKYVVDGEKAQRFCPLYPDLEINATADVVKNSQTEFYAIDLNKPELNLLEGETAGLIRLDSYEAEKHGTLRHLASVYHPDNQTLQPGLTQQGPRVLNFADILKYNYIPLAKTIEVVLDVVKEAMGAPVEIEFAVDLTKKENGLASFYLLQIKPLLGSAQNYSINEAHVSQETIVLKSLMSMGNGKDKQVCDIIVVDRARFDKAKTKQMAEEIEQLNTRLKMSQTPYILLGPGRWGTRDPWIGIPVTWPQIAQARMIVETDLPDFPLEASGGSHFFHNVTSMKVGYCSIQQGQKAAQVNWDLILAQQQVQRTEHFIHVRFPKPLTIRMDGKKRMAIVSLPDG